MANNELTSPESHPAVSRREEETLRFWEENKIFEKSLEQRKGAKPFVFFEGPPTANARPAIHHFIGRAFKDLFCRFQTMRGHFVGRKSGWDTQGLPVEIEVEKALGLKSKKEIEEYGVAEFNAKAKASVWKYQEEWERFSKRIAFWLDLEHPYITYDPNYIESAWWVVKQAAERDLLFKDYKVVPYCARCGTSLSAHEVAQGYETVTDNSVIVKFKIKSPLKTINYKLSTINYLLAWTTTPWTLPGNVGLAVSSDISYSAVLVDDKDELLILATDLVERVLSGHSVKTLSTFNGDKLLNLKYEPLFNIKELQTEAAYQVYPADFVTTTDGTGIVHTAVMYGEEDYQLGIKVGLPRFHTVDRAGRFVETVPAELAGKAVKDPATEAIITNYLKEKNLLYKEEAYEHEYPFCWRCKTPLLYYAMDSWFIATSKLKDKLLANNDKVNWYPAHIKDGRFG
ncbi:MAG: Isoleucine-tRNA ligase, partial [Parcubacteria group bacterium GW2011_GWA1_47_11]